MARTSNIVHVAYTLNDQPHVGTVDPDSIRLHGSKVHALEDAVDNGGKYAPWPHGKTLAEAIAEHEANKLRSPKREPKPAGRAVRDEPQA